VKSPYFPKSPEKAIMEGFNNCDEEFITNHALGPNNIVADKSGSCALVMMIVDKQVYIANTGDSRAIMSINGQISVLSNDHKPNNDSEKKRILKEGGRVYQTQTYAKNFNIKLDNIHPEQLLFGPFRVFPGRLSVSRSFGDVEAKLPMFNGNPNILISTPEIKSFTINEGIEWFCLACKLFS
jgi:protein phosphatase 2C family protein 2/3